MIFPKSFTDFYKIIHGYPAYIWQSQLAEKLINNEWEECLPAGTGFGKTSFMDCWYFALIQQMLKGNRQIPVRYTHVIDLRTAVDEVETHAKKLLQGIKQFPELMKIGLNVFKLRGGEDQRRNLENEPTVPTIISTTIDMFGSRLMFRGYGVSLKSRTIAAGLAANDTLLALDEADKNQPFKKIVKEIFSRSHIQGLVPSRIVELTAVPNNTSTKYKFDYSDLQHLISHKKKIHLHAVKKDVVKKIESLTAKALAETPAICSSCSRIEFDEETHCISCGIKLSRKPFILIIVNTVHRGRTLLNTLKKKYTDVYFITGQQRAYEKNAISTADWFTEMKDRSKRTKPIICIGTQAVEISLDIDADVIITELAALDAIIQRAGRLNRHGKLEFETNFHVVYDESKEEDKIYRQRATETLLFLKQFTEKDEGSFPIPIHLLTSELIKKTFVDDVPVLHLSDADVERLNITYPHKQFDIDKYLKGIQPYDTDVCVVWRDAKWFNEESLKKGTCLEALKLIKLKSAEIIRIPISALKTKTEMSSDCYCYSPKDQNSSRFKDKYCAVSRYDKYSIKKIENVLPGDIVFLPTNYGGLDQWGWCQDSEKPVNDIYNKLTGKKYHYDERIKNFIDNPQTKKIAKKLGINLKGEYKIDAKISGNVAVFYPTSKYGKDNNTMRDSLTLDGHTKLVIKYAKQFCEKLGLKDFLELFELVGKYHDLGKADRRFQINMGQQTNVLLGKMFKKGEKKSPDFWRHELLSIQILEDSKIQVEPLIAHLIGTHHGYYRPYAPIMIDDKFQQRNLEVCGEKFVSKQTFKGFINPHLNELSKEYGAWGLAFLETIFRLADHKASKE